jgi:tetratricopeptide (TPR) repeat protein
MLRAQTEARVLKERTLGPSHPDVGFSLGNTAYALQELGRSEEALTYADQALAILKKGLGVGHPDIAMGYNNRGTILNALGRYPEARVSFEQACAIWERELGPDDRNIGDALTGLGVSYLAEGKAAESLIPLERAFKIRQSREKDPARVAETGFAFARALWDSNRDRIRAKALAEEAKSGYTKKTDAGKLHAVETWLEARSSQTSGPRKQRRQQRQDPS